MTPRRIGALALVAIALLLGDIATERIGAHAIVDAPNQGRSAELHRSID